MTDARDGRTYKTVKIGEQTWMAENLNFEMADSYCYSDSASYCNKYGRLYTWAAVNSACPEGWHLPSETEWNALFRVVEKRTSISWALRSASDWDRNKSVNPFGFSALPAGERYINHFELRERDGRRFIDDRPEYRAGGSGTRFWGSTEKRDPKDDQWYSVRLDEYKVFATSDSDRYLDCRPHCYRNYAYSIRCLKD